MRMLSTTDSVVVAGLNPSVSNAPIGLASHGANAPATDLPPTGLVVAFPDVLDNKTAFPLSLDEFTHFLENVEHSAENIRFYGSVRKYERLYKESAEAGVSTTPDGTDSGKTIASAPAVNVEQFVDDLINKYVEDDAPEQVNIRGATRKALLEEYKASKLVHPDKFQEAKTEIYQLMMMDSFARWVRRQTTQNLDHKGVCQRRDGMIMFGTIAAVLLLLSITLHWSIFARFALLVPLYLTTIFYEQWQAKFCVKLGGEGTRTAKDGTLKAIADNRILFMSAMKAKGMLRKAFVKALLLLALCFVPPNTSGQWDLT